MSSKGSQRGIQTAQEFVSCHVQQGPTIVSTQDTSHLPLFCSMAHGAGRRSAEADFGLDKLFPSGTASTVHKPLVPGGGAAAASWRVNLPLRNVCRGASAWTCAASGGPSRRSQTQGCRSIGQRHRSLDGKLRCRAILMQECTKRDKREAAAVMKSAMLKHPDFSQAGTKTCLMQALQPSQRRLCCRQQVALKRFSWDKVWCRIWDGRLARN